MQHDSIPRGLCQCGCGRPTRIADRNRRAEGHVKGEPIPFVNGHNRRGTKRPQRWQEEDRGYVSRCWIWTGYVQANGYGKTAKPDGARGMTYAHRCIYEELVGPIPVGMDLDHLCRQRACVNPSHLEPVTRGENLRRGWAVRKGKNHGEPQH